MPLTYYPEIFDTPRARRPTSAWANDGVDIKATLGAHFDTVREGQPPEEITPPGLRDIVFWGFYAPKPR